MKVYQDEGWLREHYIDRRMSMLELADLAGCTYGTIQYWFAKHGIPSRSKSEGKQIANSRKLRHLAYTDVQWLHHKYWDEGLDTKQIAKLANVSPPTIIRWMQKLGVPRRDKSEAGKKNWREEKIDRENFVKGLRAAWARGVFDDQGYRDVISEKAKERWANGHYDGEKHPRWLGGKSFEPYPMEFNEEYKEKIRERDKRRCILCGKDEKENGRRLSVHHITYDKDNLDPDTKVSLCDSCHGKTNSNRQFWTTVFTRYWRRASVQDWQVRKVVL